MDALLETSQRILARRSVSSIVQVIDSVAQRLLDSEDSLRRSAEHALPAITGASPAMARRVLDGMASDWRAERLNELLQAEFGHAAVLERFRPRPGLDGVESRALAPRLTTHFFSGNVPGVAVTSLIRALLVRSPSLGKTAVGEPLLPALFSRGIAEADPELGQCLAVTYWPGGESAMELCALERAEAVVVYGGGEAVRSVRSRVESGVRFLGYGHRLSFGAISRESLHRTSALDLAAAAALDVATFDQQGCVSPHLFYVERGGETSPREWARQLADALDRVEIELPRGRLAPGEASAIRQLRGEMEFAQLAGRGTELHASAAGTSWTVIYDPDPSFAASCLNRTVRVKPVDDLDAVATLIAPVAAVLQTVGLAAPGPRGLALSEQLALAGASRIASIGSMSWPEPYWLHDGRPPLRDLVRWCDRESGPAGE